MNNFNKIKAMSIDEMAEFLSQYASTILVKTKASFYASDNLVIKWLESEEE